MPELARLRDRPQKFARTIWSVPTEWTGETAFIVAGGPSVAGQNIDLLKGRKVIVINSSYQRVPWADYLFFGDRRWWLIHKEQVANFAGRVVTVEPQAAGKNILHLRKVPPPYLSQDRQCLAVHRTSLTAAINLAVLLGVARIVLLGADGRRGSDGRSHHHDPHPWPQQLDCWQDQLLDLEPVARQLKTLGIECLNASPGSAWDLWPIVTLESVS